jgi:hypothetical protein
MRYTILLCSLAVCLASCKKEEYIHKGPDCSNTDTKYLSQEISSFKFKKGSYWVFVDSVSLSIDTMRVDTVLTDGLYAYQYCPNNYHAYYSFRVNQPNTQANSGFDVYLLDEVGMKLNATSENYPTIYDSNSPKIDSLFVFDRYYKQVVKISAGPAGSNTVSYINKTDGFLKKEVYLNNQLVSKKLLKDKYILR